MSAALLEAAYNLLGDGQGAEWLDNPEYTRAIAELIADVVGLPEFIDRGGDEFQPFVLGMIFGAYQASAEVKP